jgi:hypothetical protein
VFLPVTVVDFTSPANNVGAIVSGQETLRIVPGATAVVVRDSGDSLNAATFNAAGTLLTLNGGLTVTGTGGANVALFGAGSFGSGAGVLSIINATTAPTSDPTGGYILYGDPTNGLMVRSPSGAITSIAPA